MYFKCSKEVNEDTGSINQDEHSINCIADYI